MIVFCCVLPASNKARHDDDDCLYLCLYYVSAIRLVNKVVCVCAILMMMMMTINVGFIADMASKNRTHLRLRSKPIIVTA